MVEVGANVARMQQDMGKMERTVHRFTKRAGGMFKILGASMVAYIGAAAIGNAFRKVISLTNEAMQAAQEQEVAERTLATALGYTSDALLEQASSLQKVTAFGDETIIRAQALLAMFVKDEKQIKAATKATLDLAAAKGMKLKDSADLVSKTLGSTTNALSRYGIQVTGAVGSTERLESLVTNLNYAFGGQAEALAGTFRGRLKQVKDLYGDLHEELGYVITRNRVFVESLGIVKRYLGDATKSVKENRLWLMELAKSGFVYVIEALGKTLEVMRFFHNAWNGIKFVVKGALHSTVSGLALVYKGLRFIMKPLDLLYRGLVALGMIDVNPFDAIQNYFEDFKTDQLTGMAEIWENIKKSNKAYDLMGEKIAGFVAKVRALDVAEIKVDVKGDPGKIDKLGEAGKRTKKIYDSIWSATAGMLSLEGERDEYVRRIAESAGKQKKHYDSIWSATAGMLSLEGERDALLAKTPKTLEEIWDEYRNLMLASDNWIAGAKIGFQDFANDAARAGQMARDVVVGGIYSMEDAVVGFAHTGKIQFKDFASSVIADITRILTRMAFIQPLLAGLGFGSAAIIPTAKGNVFASGKIIPFDRGGVVTKPTIFPMARGAGLMAEKGPEAVMPLVRTRGGDLGVKAEGGTMSQPLKIEIKNEMGISAKIKEAKGISNLQGTVVTIILDAIDRNVGGMRDVMRGARRA
jgi:lambda family phage tail tape measure protein